MAEPQAFDVISLGSATQDVFVAADDAELVRLQKRNDDRVLLAFEYGAKIGVEEMFITTGGAATNTGVTFARFGLKTAVVCKVGNDAAGGAIRDRLVREGIGVQFIVTDPEHRTGYSAILLGFTGDRTVLAHRGATLWLREDEIDWEALARARLLFVGSLSGDTARLYPKLAAFAAEHGILFAINPGSTQYQAGLDGLAPVLQHTDVIFMNKEEAYLLTGVEPDRGHEDEVEMCCLVHQVGAKRVVITAGAQGADAYDGTEHYLVPAYEVQVASTLGAGDAFASACAAALLRGEDFPRALRIGAANAASVVTGIGAKRGILSWEQAQAWVDRAG